MIKVWFIYFVLFAGMAARGRWRTEIKRNAVVRRVIGNYIGCQFTATAVYDPDIGFYLRMK